MHLLMEAKHWGLIFFFNATRPTGIYTLSLHDALPISPTAPVPTSFGPCWLQMPLLRSEEHTSELQSRFDLVCRLLLEKKKRTQRRACTQTRSLPRSGCAYPSTDRSRASACHTQARCHK